MNFTIKENVSIGEKYYYKKHESGLDIYIIPKKHTMGFAVFGTNFGSIDNHFILDGKEIKLPDGIAHFLEHKLFENEDGIDTFKKYAKYGASANAYTSFDKTVYLFSATENFTDSLKILLEFVTNPYFTDETVKKEQGIIGQEIRMYDDNPGWRVYFNMLRALYVNHPAHIDIAGTIETISEITPEILHMAYNAFYNLNNMALCICADIEPEEVEKAADSILKKARPLKLERILPNEPKNIFQKEISLELQVSMPLFAIGIKDPETMSKGSELMKKSAEFKILLELILGKASPLYTRLYEEGLINSSFSFGYEGHESFAHCEISGYSSDPSRVYDEILKEINLFHKKGFDNDTFERIKKVLYAQNLRIFDSTDDIANNFLSYIFTGGDLLDYPSIISSITLDDIIKRFETSFLPEYSVLSKVVPISK